VQLKVCLSAFRPFAVQLECVRRVNVPSGDPAAARAAMLVALLVELT
jgi:hypothetical protein